MKLTHTAAAALIAMAATAAPTMTFGQTCCAPAGNDWPEVNGNIGAWQYSSLTQINQSNLNNLGPAWVVHVSAEPITTPVAGPGDNSTANQETSPIVVNGIMYLDRPSGGVIALDGATGAVKWNWQPSVAANGFGPNTSFHRGVSVGGGRVYTTASGNRVVALDQNTGALLWAVQPTASDGLTLGTIQKAHTMYYDGLVIQGTNDSARGAIFALNANDGSMAWYFYSTYPHGTVFTDVNNNTIDAGDTWTTKNTPNDMPNNCYLTAGATPWQHPTIDPALGMVYVTFGNVRSCTGAQDGSTRFGTNLFGSSIVALDLKTGAYKWHYQTIRHEHWDQDAVLPPQIADVTIGGVTRKVVYVGSKAGHQYVLDRTNGKPVLAVEDRLVPIDTRSNAWPTQPFPVVGAFIEQCVTYQNLGSDVPGLPNRAVPNWNGYQAQPDPANPGQFKLVLTEPNYLDSETPFMQGPPRVGCIEEDSLLPWLSMSSSNGTADMSVPAYSPPLNLRWILYNYSPAAHPIAQGGNSLRQIGGYQTGGITALNASTMQVVWKKQLPLDASRQNNPVVTATGLLFFSGMDGWLTAMDASTGDVLWRFQTGFPSQSGTITYMIDGVQYIAMVAMAGNQPYSQTPNGDAVWVFKLGGNAVYTTGPRSAPVVVSGSAEAPTPKPIPPRRPVDNTAQGAVPNNTIYMARSNGTATATKDSTATASMVPSTLTVPVGTTVTFTNPGDATFGVAGSGNLLEHCATQFFEGKFNFRLQPGQSAQYTFTKAGEYFYNDCTDPRPSGKVVAVLTPTVLTNAAKFMPGAMDMRTTSGVIPSGLANLVFQVPAGYVLDGGASSVTLTAPLTTAPITAVSVYTTGLNGQTLVASFNKRDIANNVPTGPTSLTVNGIFVNNGVQALLTTTAPATVQK